MRLAKKRLFLNTLNERTNLYTNVTHELADNIDMFFRASYTNRTAVTKAAPEPLCLGNECGNKLDSAMFTDLRFSYNPPVANDALTLTLGFNNVLDEDPPVCNPCGSIGMSRVAHDIPGRVTYLRLTYQQD